ncbi:MAG TPA: hypothetical protein VGX75_18450, partial [bacterium]|nr:hypothetical protein [bacterium]
TIRAGLKYGQALAAWSCGFEGARGGMYAVDRSTFDKQIRRLMSGRSFDVARPTFARSAAIVPCPSCPPEEVRRKTRHD